MMYVSKTPLRVSLFGGGTDYPEYFENNPSAVLGGTINKYIYTSAVDLAPFAEQRFRVSYRVVEDCNTADEISHPVIREVLKEANYNAPTGFYTVSDLPGSTGLGSSSSFTVGFIQLIQQISNSPFNPYSRAALASQAIRIERDVLGENVGVQDQTHAAFGGLACYDFGYMDYELFCEERHEIVMEQQLIELSDSRMKLLNQSMVLVYTDIQRHASEVVSSQIEQTIKGSNADYLNTMYEMVGEGKNILEREGNDAQALRDLGALLNQSWALKQNLGKGVTNATVNDIYNTGRDMGAWGGKLLGAGGGGFVMFLLTPELIPNFRAEFGANNVIPVEFVSQGSQIQAV